MFTNGLNKGNVKHKIEDRQLLTIISFLSIIHNKTPQNTIKHYSFLVNFNY